MRDSSHTCVYTFTRSHVHTLTPSLALCALSPAPLFLGSPLLPTALDVPLKQRSGFRVRAALGKALRAGRAADRHGAAAGPGAARPYRVHFSGRLVFSGGGGRAPGCEKCSSQRRELTEKSVAPHEIALVIKERRSASEERCNNPRLFLTARPRVYPPLYPLPLITLCTVLHVPKVFKSAGGAAAFWNWSEEPIGEYATWFPFSFNPHRTSQEAFCVF